MTAGDATPEVLADLMEQGSLIHRLAGALTVAAAIAVPVIALAAPHRGAMALLSGAVALGLAETLLAFRVDFDARSLRRIASHADGLSRFDGALVALGLLPQDRAGRSMADRAKGCLRLLRLQALAAMAEIVVVLSAGWIAV